MERIQQNWSPPPSLRVQHQRRAHSRTPTRIPNTWSEVDSIGFHLDLLHAQSLSTRSLTTPLLQMLLLLILDHLWEKFLPSSYFAKDPPRVWDHL